MTIRRLMLSSMFKFESGNANSGQQGFHGDIKVHTVRAGLRWSFQ